MRQTIKLEAHVKARVLHITNVFHEQSGSTRHVAVESIRVIIHHEQQLIYGLMEWRDELPHHTIQALKLPLSIGHLTHHGTQGRTLQQKQSMSREEVGGRDWGGGCFISSQFKSPVFVPEQPRRPTPTHHQGPLCERWCSWWTAVGTETPAGHRPVASPCICRGIQSKRSSR